MRERLISMKKQYLLTIVMMTLLVSGMIPGITKVMIVRATSSNVDLSQVTGGYNAVDGNVLTGSTSGTVTIADDAKITLSGATITGGIVCEGSATITLVGENVVNPTSLSAYYKIPGIQIGGSGTTLTIKGDGSLTATGGSASAGIGLGRTWDANATGGSIVIESGNITASGDIGIGIGTVGNSKTASLDGIIIKGGTINASLGNGYLYSGSSVTIGTITIYDGIDKVDASKITTSVTYMHVENETATDVTSSASTYFTIIEDGDRRIIEKKDDTDYSITIADGIEHGSIAYAATTAKYGEKITITATPNFGYRLSCLVVKDAENNDVASTGNSFFMPKSNVTVSPVFEQGTHGTTEFVLGDFGPTGFVREASIYDGLTTVNLQQGQSYMIVKYDNEYSYRKFLLDNNTYNVTIPYSGGTGTFLENGKATNFKVDYNGEEGFYDITMTDVGNDKWRVSIQKTVPVVADITDQTYKGIEIQPEPLVQAGSLNLTKGTDYEYSYESNINVGTAKVTVIFNGDYASLGSVEKEFKIVKATPTVTSPTAKTLTYTGSAQELVTAGSSTFGTVLYSLDGQNYSADIPTGTAAETYTVYYKVEGSDNWDAVDAATVESTIAPKPVTSENITITIPSQTYKGSALTPVITVKDGETTLIEGTDYTVTAPSDTIQDASDYTYTITGKGNYIGQTTATFTIAKATPNVTAPKANTLTYNGSEQELVTAGSTDHGTLLYSLDGKNYSSNIPKGTDAGKYTVYYKVDEQNYWYAQKTLEVTIDKATLYVKTAPTTSAITYGQTLNDSTLNDGVIQYSKNIEIEVEGTFAWKDSTLKPSVADSEKTKYEVTFTPIDSNNYESVTMDVTLKVNKATPTVTSPTAKTLTYTGSAQELVTAGSTDFGKVLYSLDGKKYSEEIAKGTDAGDYTVYYKVEGTDNWNAVEAKNVKVSIEPKEVSLDWENRSFTYDGTVKTPSVTAGGLISGDSCDVTVTGGQIIAGSYTATAESLSNSNYSLPAEKTTTFEINKATTTPNTPEQTMDVDYSVKKVGDIKLSGDWAIRDTDKDKDLVVGINTVTAVYTGSDKGNYVTESVAIEVTRAECKHTGMVATEAKAQTCVDAGNTAYWYCPECGRYYSDSKGETEIAKDSWILKALGHEYGEPIYTWSDDGKTCTAKTICTRKECTDDTEGHTVTETVQSTGKETKAATCEEKGITTYTATFENELFKTQTKEVADIPAKGHISSEAVKENVVAETCEEEGTYDEVVYCSECNKELSREEKKIPAKGHIYGITTYTWSEDGKSCTATSVCSNDSTHKMTETAIYEPDKADSQIKATVKEAATTEKMGTTTYTAIFKNAEMFKVQTKDVVDIPKVEVTDNPSDEPSDNPTDNPSDTPSDNPTDNPNDTPSDNPTDNPTDKPSDNPSKPTDTTNPTDTTKPSDTTKTDGNTSSNDNTKDTPVTPAPKEEGAKLPVTDTKAEYVVTSKAGEEPAVEYKPASDAADKTVSIPESVTVDGVTYAVNEIADNAFKGNKTVESVVIPKSVKEIGDSAFSGCTKLKSVTIPGSVTEIGNNAFSGCTNLKSVKIPESVTEIGDKAFSGCKKLKSVTIGKNVAEIGDSAFVNCSALTKATLPANVIKLDSNIFKGCKKLKTITIKSTKLTAKNISKNAFKGIGNKVTIKVPKKMKKAYTKLFRKKGLSKKVKIK
ncbi:MAG: leucine-rich repeat protein [Lachnospiraceae bacterium]|nr:leucine-rich repeat protein [Lachnospiraceae bacterium]